jgi:hypothetical protein
MAKPELEDANPGTVSFLELQRPSSDSPRAVLKELFLLLEEYGPGWYTAEHRRHALAALRMGDD